MLHCNTFHSSAAVRNFHQAENALKHDSETKHSNSPSTNPLSGRRHTHLQPQEFPANLTGFKPQNPQHSALAKQNLVSMAEIHARQLSTNANIPEHREEPDFAKSYQVPSKNNTFVTGEMDTPNRSMLLYANQQDAVEFAIRSGIPTSFQNGDGRTNTVTIKPLSVENGACACYRVLLESGGQLDVYSHIGISRTIEAIANILEWGTTFNARSGIRVFPGRVVIDNAPYPGGVAAASYDGKTDTMTFYDGHRYITEPNYNHEMGHAVGWQLDDTRSGISGFASRWSALNQQDFTPVNWESVMAEATTSGIDSITHYAETNAAEDFAESMSAYMHARDSGTAALDSFRNAYPYRSGYLDNNVFADK